MPRYIERAEIDLILAVIRGWVNLLAQKNFRQAAAYLAPVPGNEAQHSARNIEESLGLYSRRYREAPESDRQKYVPVVTPFDDMDAAGENMTIYKKGTEAPIVEYDIPIEGRWSDLTAKFRLMEFPEGFGIALIDLHVL